MRDILGSLGSCSDKIQVDAKESCKGLQAACQWADTGKRLQRVISQSAAIYPRQPN